MTQENQGDAMKHITEARKDRIARNGSMVIQGEAIVSDSNGPFRLMMRVPGFENVVNLDTSEWSVEWGTLNESPQPAEGVAELIAEAEKRIRVIGARSLVTSDELRFGQNPLVARLVAALSASSRPSVHFAPWQAETTACELPVVAPRDAALTNPSDKWSTTTCAKCLAQRPTPSDEEIAEVQLALKALAFMNDETDDFPSGEHPVTINKRALRKYLVALTTPTTPRDVKLLREEARNEAIDIVDRHTRLGGTGKPRSAESAVDALLAWGWTPPPVPALTTPGGTK